MTVECYCGSYNDAVTYCIKDNGKCLIVDPANPLSVIKRYVGDDEVVGILLTHGHYDHFHELRSYLDYYKVKVYLHNNAVKKISNDEFSCASLFNKYIDFSVSDDEMVKINNDGLINIDIFNVYVYQFPGHTSCSVGFNINHNLFFGDFLFINSTGRYDLPTASYKALTDSIEKFKSLINKNIIHNSDIIYSGHDDSFVVSDLYKYNPYFRKNRY